MARRTGRTCHSSDAHDTELSRLVNPYFTTNKSESYYVYIARVDADNRNYQYSVTIVYVYNIGVGTDVPYRYRGCQCSTRLKKGSAL